MSTTISSPSYSVLQGPQPSAPWRAWWREPLLHFMLLGALLFGLDHLLVSGRDDPHTIIVSKAMDDQTRHMFQAARGRLPSKDEMTALRRVWLDNEVLYREGLALEVDKGDDAIRERVIFKALSIVDANVKLPQITDQQLREWFASHRDKYDEPARYDFDEAIPSGEASEAAVRALVSSLNSAQGGDTHADLRVFKQRPRSNLVASYGSEFAAQLDTARRDEWLACATRDGWRAIRLDQLSPPKPADLEALRAVVMQDWTDATSAEQRTAAVRELAKKYTIKIESAP